jgi:uncharacterized membrane protein YozB (DUF420 family)
MILLNVAAFAPSLVDQSMRNEPLPLTALVAAHAAIAVAWLALFLTQVTLVAARRTRLHRRLGVASVVLVAGFVATGVATVVVEARRGFDLSGDLGRLPPQPETSVQASILGQLFFFGSFALLAGSALWFRKRPAIHKRLMLLAILGGLTATPVAHLLGHSAALRPWAGLLLPGSLLCALALPAVFDRASGGRLHPLSTWGAAAVFLSILIFNVAIVPSGVWQDVALWLTR